MQTLTPILAVGDLIPVVSIILGLSIPIVAIIADFARRRTIYELHHKERLAAIEKGIELPSLLTEGLGPRARPRYLLRGLLWLFGGLGTLLALSGITRPEADKAWLLGFIPTGVGLAYLIYYLVEGRRLDQESAKVEAETARIHQ